ncbi:MAG: hypothetical protein AB7V46_19350 [Thermomicrobiales bacterium]
MTEVKKFEFDAEKAMEKLRTKELISAEAFLQRQLARKPAPKILLTKEDGVLRYALLHKEQKMGCYLLMEALRIPDEDFLFGFLEQLIDAGTRRGEAHTRTIDFLLSAVRGIEPRDHIETMLAAQMAVVHMSMMSMTRLLAEAVEIAQQDSAERALNKLARTFVSQMEALRRHRSGGQQTVKVERVTVHEGGQAIVGNVTQAGNRAVRQDAAAARIAGPSSPEPTGIENKAVSGSGSARQRAKSR